MLDYGGAGILGRFRSEPRTVYKRLTLTGNNNTSSQNIFTLTGSILVTATMGEVITSPVNHTGGLLRLNDSATTVDITASGQTLSGLAAGSTFYKYTSIATALGAQTNANGVASNIGGALSDFFYPVALFKKTAATTTVEYRYATTETPTVGVLDFYLTWIPISGDGNLVAV